LGGRGSPHFEDNFFFKITTSTRCTELILCAPLPRWPQTPSSGGWCTRGPPIQAPTPSSPDISIIALSNFSSYLYLHQGPQIHSNSHFSQNPQGISISFEGGDSGAWGHPTVRGAYCCPRVGSHGARAVLGEPVSDHAAWRVPRCRDEPNGLISRDQFS